MLYTSPGPARERKGPSVRVKVFAIASALLHVFFSASASVDLFEEEST